MSERLQPNAFTLPPRPDRVLLRYHGGKSRLAKWCRDNMPFHTRYVEPYGGGASVLLNKREVSYEVYNDIDDEVVGLFKVLRTPVLARELVAALELTPNARTEFKRSYKDSDDPVERARRLCVRVMQGWGSKALSKEAKGTWRANDGQTGYGQDWFNYTNGIGEIVDRLRKVSIENMHALDVLDRVISKAKDKDIRNTLAYCDPPYLLANGDATYKHDMDEAAHKEFLDYIVEWPGMVIISGYPNTLYEKRLRFWTALDKSNYTDTHGKRTEVAWFNPLANAGRPKGLAESAAEIGA